MPPWGGPLNHPGGPLNPPRAGREMRSPINSVDEGAECEQGWIPSSGAPEHREGTEPNMTLSLSPGTERGQGLTGLSHPPREGKVSVWSTREQKQGLYV